LLPCQGSRGFLFGIIVRIRDSESQTDDNGWIKPGNRSHEFVTEDRGEVEAADWLRAYPNWRLAEMGVPPYWDRL